MQSCSGRGPRTGWGEDPCTGSAENPRSGPNRNDALAQAQSQGHRMRLPPAPPGWGGPRCGGIRCTPARHRWLRAVPGLLLPGRSPTSTGEGLRGGWERFPAWQPGARRSSSPRHPPHLSLPGRPLAAARMRKSGQRAETAPGAMSAAGLSASDSGGRPDSCRTVPACPLPPLRKGLGDFRRGRSPEPVPAGPRGQRRPEGVKKFAQLGHWARRGEGGARGGGGGEVEAPRCPAGGGVAGDEGFPGSAGHDRLPGLPEAALPAAPSRASRRGPAAPQGQDAVPARPAALAPARLPAPVAGRAGAENHTPARRPDAGVQSPPSAPASPGRDRLVRLSHLNLDRPRGTGAASLPKRLSRALGRRRGGARRELQQFSLALLPCPAQEPR